MAMTQSELDYIFSKFNSDYMDTVYACVNIFPKRKDGKKVGVRWAVRAKHGNEGFLFSYGDTLRGSRKGYCIYTDHYGNNYSRTLIERTPEQVQEWCENIFGGKERFQECLNTVNQEVWEDVITF